MADKSWSQQEQSNSSAVIDMSDMHDDDASDYDADFTNDSDKKPSDKESGSGEFMSNVQKRLGTNVGSYVWQQGSERAKKAFSVYGNIDIFRPYFDVEPQTVRNRLLFSLVPVRPTDEKQTVPRELYGPTMLVFTMIALLLFQMKTADHKVEEGTLMGSAFGVCFGYWFGTASFVWFLSYVCVARITMIQILSMLGYGLFGHCIVLFLGTVYHTSHDHVFFYVLWAIFGGLSTLRMVSILVTRTKGSTQKLIVCGALAALHLLFLIYLHFAYHQIVEDLSKLERQAFGPIPVAVQPSPDVHKPLLKVTKEATKGLGSKLTQGSPAPSLHEVVTKSVVHAVEKVVEHGKNMLENGKNALPAKPNALMAAINKAAVNQTKMVPP